MPSIRYPRLTSLIALSLALGELDAINAFWVPTGPGTDSWNVAANWSTNPTIPNSPNDVANFVPQPSVSQATIDGPGALTFTIGTLKLQATANGMPPDVTFDSAMTLKFQATNKAQINVGSGIATYFLRNKISLISDLDIFQNNLSSTSAFTLDGVISGANNINYWGPGEMIFGQTTANAYTGTTTINNGTLNLAGTAFTIVGPLIVQNTGIIDINQPNQLGPSVNVTVQNQGQFFANGNNQSCNSMTVSAGIVTMNGGTMTLTASGVPALILRNGQYDGNLDFPNGGFISCNNTSGGSSTISNAQINLEGNLNVPIEVLGGPNNFLTIRETIVTNGTLRKTGTGTLGIGGTIDNYPAFTVAEGILSVGQVTITSITVNPGAFLEGGGVATTSGGIFNNGTLAPDTQDETGLFIVRGSYNQGATGTLAIDIANSHTGDADQLEVVNGSVSLAGALDVNLISGGVIQNGDQIVIVDNTSGTGVTGTFATFNSNLPSNVHASLIYNPFSVLLAFDVLSMPTFFNVSSPIFATNDEHNLQMIRRCQFMRSRLSSPNRADMYAAEPALGFSTDGLTASAGKILASAPAPKKEQIDVSRFRNTPEGKPVSFYFGPLGSFGKFGNIQSQKGFNYNTAGGIFGGDYAMSWAGIGAEIGYEHVDASVKDHAGSFDIDNVFGRIYSTIAPSSDPHMFLDIAVGMGGQWYNIRRNINDATAEAQTHGWEWDTYFGFGYDAWFDNVRLTPLLAVQAIDLYIKKYRENSAGADNVVVGHQHRKSLRSDVGMSLGGRLVRESVTWLPEIRGTWQHEFLDHRKKVGIAATGFEATSQVTVFGSSRNYGIIGTEQRFLFADKWTIAGDYDFQWGKHQHSNNFLFELGVYF